MVERIDVEDCIGIEKVVHGRRWNAVHGGYFSDPAVARTLVETAAGILTKSPADVIVDLGGGTGFLLSELASHGITAGTTMVNLDCSEAQLALTEGPGVSHLCVSLGDFRRGAVAAGDQRCFFLMRSVLHYLGQDGLSPMLRHLRDQARKGEFFLHQTASFDNAQDAACLNALYRRMHTPKWYPTVHELKSRLAGAGWHVAATTAAPALPLASKDLARRYALDPGEIRRARDIISAEFGERQDVFELTPCGFQAKLHYRIYTCVAREPQSLPEPQTR
jgi:hypothetical protein